MIDDGSTDRTVEVAREHGVDHVVRLDEQPGAGRGVPGRPRRLAEARRRHHRQHRRRQPVLRRRHPEARGADPRRRRRHGDRRPQDRPDRALLAAEEAPPAPRQRGGAPRVRHERARHHLGLPRLQPRGRAADAGGLQVHLHARVDHPGGQDARGGRPRPDPDERARRASRACSRRCGRTCAATPSRSSASTRCTSRCGCSWRPPRSRRSSGAVIWARFLYFFFFSDDPGQHIQSLILGSTMFIVAVQLASLGVIGDILAGSRVLQQRVLERIRRVELHLGVAPVALRAGQPPRAASRPPPARSRAVPPARPRTARR